MQQMYQALQRKQTSRGHTCRLKMGVVVVLAALSSPLWMASMIARV